MTLTNIASTANDYTDESLSTGIIKSFVNGAISKINITLKSTLPVIDDTEPYTALSDDWVHTVIIPYVCWGIKMNDSSTNEANMYLYQYESGLRELKKNKQSAVAEEYQGDSFKTVFKIERYVGM